MVSETEAVVRYHCFRNKEMIRDGLIRVIDIHKHDTDITVVRKDANRIKPVFGQCITVGGDALTEKMLEYYQNKLRQVNGDISGDTNSICVMKGMTEKAKLRMAGHRLETDEFIFH